jgi:hypothetical protein
MNFALKSIPTEQAKPATKDAKTAAYLHKSAGIQINLSSIVRRIPGKIEKEKLPQTYIYKHAPY